MDRGNLFVPSNILITGGAGFIASHVVQLLCTKYDNYKIVVLDSLEYCGSLKNLESVASLDNFTFVQGDVRSADLLKHILTREDIDTVLHFAAQTHVDNSFGNSFTFSETNILGTHVLLEASVACKSVKRFVHVSTDEVYGESSFTDSKSNCETNSLLAPTNPYSASKAAAEMLVMAYGQTHSLPYIITRGNNVYGPRQFPEKAIPKFIHLLKSDRQIPIHGDGLALRSYMYVSDAAEAFDTILHKGTPNNVYNIGAEDERTILSVAKDLCDLFNKSYVQTITHVTDRAFNDRRYFVDCSKLKNLGWRQQVGWQTGLQKTLNWYTDVTANDYWDEIENALQAHPTMSSKVAYRTKI